MFWLWPHVQSKMFPRTRHTNALGLKGVLWSMKSQPPHQNRGNCDLAAHRQQIFSTPGRISLVQKGKGKILSCRTWCLFKSPIISKCLWMLVDGQAEMSMGMCSPAVASITSLALVLRSQKTFVVPLSKDTGMHFYPGKWQGLKFFLKEVSDLLKAVLRLEQV